MVLAFREGAPEVSRRNQLFAAARSRLAHLSPAAMAEIVPQLAPLPTDIVVTKRRVSAFTGSDLEVVLRSLGVQRLVLTGVSTRGVVLSTLLEAADRDYQLTVLADCCADRDPETHEFLITRIFPAQADVLTLAEWQAA